MNMYLEALDFMWPRLNSSYLLGFLVKKKLLFIKNFNSKHINKKLEVKIFLNKIKK